MCILNQNLIQLFVEKKKTFKYEFESQCNDELSFT